MATTNAIFKSCITLVTVVTRYLPPDVCLGHDALETITEFEEGVGLENENERGVELTFQPSAKGNTGLKSPSADDWL